MTAICYAERTGSQIETTSSFGRKILPGPAGDFEGGYYALQLTSPGILQPRISTSEGAKLERRVDTDEPLQDVAARGQTGASATVRHLEQVG